ncbi:protein CHUP1, chloroplastic [Arachis duranensis]|uniref:Protein CHUP1, chloroplastic n=1 Tax=Arachis duranensis TaxID=130453 RepID=A0A9C6WT98_ARADU|nr:protein CHUP1, chloroplastic [Arachis duranensis]
MVVAVGTSGKEAIGESQSPKFKDIQKLIADKLERSKVKKEATPEAIFHKASSIPSPTTTIHVNSESQSIERKSPPNQCLPPSMPSQPLANLDDMKRDIKGPLNHPQPIRVDIETKGEFINDLIKKAVDAAYMDIEEVLKFVDGELSSLVDERAVLKHFKWPEKKANAMREAVVEYQELKLLEQEISSYTDDPDIPCGAALKKNGQPLRQYMHTFQFSNNMYFPLSRDISFRLLEDIVPSIIKQASMTLAKMYMKRVTMELESNWNTDRESSQDSLLLQGVH